MNNEPITSDANALQQPVQSVLDALGSNAAPPYQTIAPKVEQIDTPMPDSFASPAPQPPSVAPTPIPVPAPARTTTPMRSTNGTRDYTPLPTKAAPHGAPPRRYLNEKVAGVLSEGMKRIAAEQPEDPLRVLGEFLLQKSKEFEGANQATT